METYSGLHADHIDKAKFWAFVGQERGRLLSFLKWAGEMRGSR